MIRLILSHLFKWFTLHIKAVAQKVCRDCMPLITRPIASENRCKLYPPERKLTKAILTLLNLEGEAQGEI